MTLRLAPLFLLGQFCDVVGRAAIAWKKHKIFSLILLHTEYEFFSKKQKGIIVYFWLLNEYLFIYLFFIQNLGNFGPDFPLKILLYTSNSYFPGPKQWLG
jgi:hypothetical protein